LLRQISKKTVDFKEKVTVGRKSLKENHRQGRLSNGKVSMTLSDPVLDFKFAVFFCITYVKMGA